MKKLLLPALAIVVLASCNNEEKPDFISNEPVEVTFGQSIGLYTKAPIEGNKLMNTTMGVYAIEYTTTPAWKATGNFMEDISLSADASGVLTYTNAADTKYYSYGTDTKYDFYAYSPKADGTKIVANALADGAAPTINATLEYTTIADQMDILHASATAKTKSSDAVALNFQHALAQVKFQIKKEADVDVTTLTAISVNANTTGTMDITSGAWSNTAAPQNFNVLTGGNVAISTTEADAGTAIMLFPETLGNNSVTFTIDGKDYSFTPSATLEAGKITTITVTVKASGVTFSQTVTAWEAASTNGTGEIS